MESASSHIAEKEQQAVPENAKKATKEQQYEEEQQAVPEHAKKEQAEKDQAEKEQAKKEQQYEEEQQAKKPSWERNTESCTCP